jgi:hypothetical protein
MKSRLRAACERGGVVRVFCGAWAQKLADKRALTCVGKRKRKKR